MQTLLQSHSTTCVYLHIVPRTWADITHTPALVPLLGKLSWCVLTFWGITRICSTDDPYCLIQSAAESERTEESSPLAAENANTVSRSIYSIFSPISLI